MNTSIKKNSRNELTIILWALFSHISLICDSNSFRRNENVIGTFEFLFELYGTNVAWRICWISRICFPDIIKKFNNATDENDVSWNIAIQCNVQCNFILFVLLISFQWMKISWKQWRRSEVSFGMGFSSWCVCVWKGLLRIGINCNNRSCAEMPVNISNAEQSIFRYWVVDVEVKHWVFLREVTKLRLERNRLWYFSLRRVCFKQYIFMPNTFVRLSESNHSYDMFPLFQGWSVFLCKCNTPQCLLLHSSNAHFDKKNSHWWSQWRKELIRCLARYTSHKTFIEGGMIDFVRSKWSSSSFPHEWNSQMRFQ